MFEEGKNVHLHKILPRDQVRQQQKRKAESEGHWKLWSSISWMSRCSEDRNLEQRVKDVCLGRVRKNKELVAMGKLSREVFVVLF